MSLRDALLENSVVYRLWQAPFAGQKFKPFLAHNDPAGLGRVLDVGCGPGTNCRHFRASDYVGIDLNPDYIARAQRAYGGRFIADNAVTHDYGSEKFDTILVNSFLHHLPDGDVGSLLGALARVLSPRGRIHIIEPLSANMATAAKVMERLDRGRHFRALSGWTSLIQSHFAIDLDERYGLGIGGIPLWHMVYFRAGPV